jgi:hypothetical protein
MKSIIIEMTGYKPPSTPAMRAVKRTPCVNHKHQQNWCHGPFFNQFGSSVILQGVMPVGFCDRLSAAYSKSFLLSGCSIISRNALTSALADRAASPNWRNSTSASRMLANLTAGSLDRGDPIREGCLVANDATSLGMVDLSSRTCRS